MSNRVVTDEEFLDDYCNNKGYTYIKGEKGFDLWFEGEIVNTLFYPLNATNDWEPERRYMLDCIKFHWRSLPREKKLRDYKINQILNDNTGTEGTN